MMSFVVYDHLEFIALVDTFYNFSFYMLDYVPVCFVCVAILTFIVDSMIAAICINDNDMIMIMVYLYFATQVTCTRS